MLGSAANPFGLPGVVGYLNLMQVRKGLVANRQSIHTVTTAALWPRVGWSTPRQLRAALKYKGDRGSRVERRTQDSMTRGSNPVRGTRKTGEFFRVKYCVVLTRCRCAQHPCIYIYITYARVQEVYSPNVKIRLGICFGVKFAIHSLTHHQSSKTQSSTLKYIKTNTNTNGKITEY